MSTRFEVVRPAQMRLPLQVTCWLLYNDRRNSRKAGLCIHRTGTPMGWGPMDIPITQQNRIDLCLPKNQVAQWRNMPKIGSNPRVFDFGVFCVLP